MSTTLSTTELSGGLGVRVDDLSVDALQDDAVIAALGELLRSRSLILAHFPELSEADQAQMGMAFGLVTDRGGNGKKPDPGRGSNCGVRPTGAIYMSNTRKDGIRGDGWLPFHHDHLFYKDPLSALMLYAIEVPTSGSETWFRCGVSALESLPAELRARADGVFCQHLCDFVKIAEGRSRLWDDPADATPGSPFDWKPLIWTDPATGRQALLQAPSTIDFRGIDRSEGIELYNEIDNHLVEHDEEIAGLRHPWKPGDLVAWDNMMIAHARPPFDGAEPRTLRRTPILPL